MSPRILFALGCLGALLATPALAFSPGPPRPRPADVTGVCSVPAEEEVCGFECQSAGGICLIDPAAETILAETRAVATLMVDEDVAYLSMSTVYRILQDQDLMCRHRGRVKRYREEVEKASRPDEIWGTDLMYLSIGGDPYYLVNFIDEYSV